MIANDLGGEQDKCHNREIKGTKKVRSNCSKLLSSSKDQEEGAKIISKPWLQLKS